MANAPSCNAAPSKRNLFSRLQRLNVPISEVVDVGVRESTQELIDYFPKLTHHLFEPVPSFFPAIRKNYALVPHVLNPLALSDTNETQYLSVTSLQRDGIATHSRIVNEARLVDGVEVISCDPIAIRRFDSLPSIYKQDFLLKVDVDGFDLQVLRGFGAKLRMASVVVVEATYMNFVERAAHLDQNGFQLLDIVDIVYYGDALYQMDIAFIRRDLVTNAVRPSMANFQRSLWRAFRP